ncbi:MAG: preprotein translocase subunit SecG [Bdellovibrionales bacterium]|nr:preprotein translocase subunit SecG [Bdellovibrionales bacterium]
MITLLTTIHVIVAVLIVIFVLLQSGKGGGLGAGFGGGGSNTLFGSSGGENFFTKFTMGLALTFMITSISLTVIKTKALKTSLFDQGAPAATAPVEQPAAPVPADQK